MEFVPSKYTINFEIIEKPCYPLDSKALSEIEGKLSISVNGKNIFDEEGILLAEFSAAFSYWINDLKTKKNQIFLYDSMDYEDSPILRIEFLDTKLAISSAWLVKDAKSPILVSSKQFINAVKLFIQELEGAIPGISETYSTYHPHQ